MGGSGLVAIALLVLAYAAVSRRLLGTVVTPAMVFVAGGIVASADVLGWLDPTIGSDSVRWVAEATLTVVLFSDASRIDLAALRREYVVPLRLLAIGLPLTIVAGALAGVALFGELAFIEAVLLAIVLAPTDAALGQAVVTDSRIPSRIRQGLNVESGLNDGICVPLLLFAITIAEVQEDAIGSGTAVHLLLEEVGYGIVGGVLAGLAAAAVIRLGVARRLIDPTWLQVIPVAGAALAYGLAVWMGGSGFIAAFVGGAVFGGLRREVGGEVTLFLEETGGLLGAVTFVLFGAVMLVPVLDDLSSAVVLYALLSLTLVRMVPVALAMLGSSARPPTVAFLGWFGPRGLASIVFAVILVEDADLAHESVLLNTIFLTVALSVLLHGATATPLAARYAAWFTAHPREAVPAFEAVPATDQRLHRWPAGLRQRDREMEDRSDLT
ncbi:MAG TPA: cation:proton antiporter [Gaiellaceae bacterium]|nr:cation:proton antiporter [Gaiellaceae bacterium]